MRVRRRSRGAGEAGIFPDGSRSFEEIDRLQIGEAGTGNLIAAKAEIDFYRVLPPAGYTKGLPADRRTGTGAGDPALISACAPMMLRVRPPQFTMIVVSGDGTRSVKR
jgi:L-asparaginase